MNLSYLFAILSILFLCSCGSSNLATDRLGLQYDMSRIAILTDSSGRRGIPTNLVQDDFSVIEKLLKQCIKDHNSGNHMPLQDLDHYKCQYVPILNKDNQKEVWVNCFCQTMDIDWKSKVVYVMDGGTCYFNVRINLTKGSYFNLYVNGSP